MSARQVRPSGTDVRTWSRALRSLPGAYGSDERLGDPVSLDGHLWMWIRLSEDQIRGIWLASGVGTDHPDSGWHKIDRFEQFTLKVAGYKMRSGFLIARETWLVIFGFGLGDARQPESLEVNSVGRTFVPSIADAFDLVEGILTGIMPIPTRAVQSRP